MTHRPSPPSLKGLVRLESSLCERMTRDLEPLRRDAAARAALRRELARSADDVERVCARRGCTPARLAPPSRRVYAWLRLLADDAHLDAHLDALQRGHRALAALTSSARPSLSLSLINCRALWRRRDDKNLVVMRVHQGFMRAPDPVWAALARDACRPRQGRRDPRFESFIDSEAFASVLFTLEAPVEPPDAALGRVHDLRASFDRVNARYFQGAMAPPPRLRWSRARAARTLGHYEPARDLVTISRVLDDPLVPPPVLDLVVYHELLHRKHGIQLVDGRRVSHTPAFRRDEARFDDFNAVQLRLRQLLARD